MRKERWKRMLNVASSVTTGTLIACTVWYGITMLGEGKNLTEARMPYLTLPQILLLGILCGIESELIMRDTDWPPKKEWLRYLLHYATVTATALICGYFFGWYEVGVSGILLMCLTSAVIYMFTSYLKYRTGKKDAEAMNECLKEIRKK